MTVAPEKPVLASGSPAEIRAGLIPEEQEQFDRAWQVACQIAAETLDLTKMQTTLETYRRHALLVARRGPDGYRRILARAEETLRTGAEPSGGMTHEQMRAMIQERLGE
ncbi:MAG TPA: DUF6247 family protein [Pseudonocardiaceae bacterium]|jgi:hypothetical protein|nr:DUF6247 family protein [Pseudonocardiaceae bacterium]